jgi:hypothetical protein
MNSILSWEIAPLPVDWRPTFPRARPIARPQRKKPQLVQQRRRLLAEGARFAFGKIDMEVVSVRVVCFRPQHRTED